LAAIDQRIRPGTLANCGDVIRSLAGKELSNVRSEPVPKTIQRLQRDLREFQRDVQAERVIVVNVASTEPANENLHLPARWIELTEQIASESYNSLPASSLYAIAALDLGMPYINFTPSQGAKPAAIQELAIERKTCHAGQDGKTGETLLKSVL